MRLRNTRLSRLLRFGKNRSGNAVLIFALCLVPMVLAAGGAVDFTRYYNAQQTVQTALDAAVLAGAASDDPTGDDTTAWQSVATETLSSWNIAIEGSLGTPDFSPREDTSDAATYAGSVTAHLKMYFTPLIGINWLDFTVTSKAEREATTTSGANVCLYLLDKTASPGLNVNGGTISATECEIDVDSTSSSAVTFDSTVNAAKICIAGTVSHVNKTPDNYYTPCDAADDPYASSMPDVDSSACSSTTSDVNYNNNGAAVTVEAGNHCGRLNFSGGNLTLYPGTYGGGINFNNSPTVTFMPGVYIIKNSNWNLDGGSYTGTGVTFYFADTSYMQFNNGAKAALSAPTSGDYSGILMYEASGLSESSWTFNMTGTLDGIIHLPSRNITFNSSSGITVDGVMVFNTLISSLNLTLSNDGTTSTTSGYSPPRLIK